MPKEELQLLQKRTPRTGEFLRKYVSRRLLALGDGEIAVLMPAMRQLGASPPGGAESLAIFHQLIFDERLTGSIADPLARVSVDEIGGLQCERQQLICSPNTLQRPGWKHRQLLHVEHDAIEPVPEDRGAEQGDVDEPLQCSLALGPVAAEARLSTTEQQFQGTLPQVGAGLADHIQQLRTDLFAKTEGLRTFSVGGPRPDTPSRIAGASQTLGTWTMATSCVTHCLHCLTS